MNLLILKFHFWKIDMLEKLAAFCKRGIAWCDKKLIQDEGKITKADIK